MPQRLPLAQLGLSTGKKARLHRILYQHGLGNGTALFLPYDQGLEHGPRDFFANPAAADPSYVIKLAVEGGFNGIALVVWSYPRGSAVDQRGGRHSFYAIDYATRVAAELGADLVKVTWPDADHRTGVRAEYSRDFSTEQVLSALVRSAGRALVLLSGGEKADDERVINQARQIMEAGATGLIFGRNVWQRDHDESLRFVDKL